ncbi:hypothetical protein [Lacihabitans sp. LS3-19]|uniref:baeRF3 domain-containing protein n=1 Tax=Lacihabitans sp. LS3-19 TaxID=2487335 RepID=UPI0020CBD213|nr:hypothetical protein [Lacihabitans sp. LS3-19]
MEILSKKTLLELRKVNSETCISLYMPTHLTHPENLQDPIEYKHLLKQLEGSLMQIYTLTEVAQYLEPFELLINNKDFWDHTSPSIAIFSANGIFKIIGLQMSFKKLAIVAESFHTKPLSQYLQTVGRYQVLGLSLDRIQLFEGNRNSLVEIMLPEEMPKTLTEVLGKQLTEKYSTTGSYGGVHVGGEGMHHGDGGKKDQIDVDTEKFYRFIDKDLLENYSKPSGLPLILAALPEHHSLFHEVSKNPFLLKEGILKNPEYISANVLAEMAWELMEPVYLLKIKKLGEQYSLAKANKLASDDLEIISAAASTGRVATLIVEAGKIIPGKITNSDTGAIEKGSINDPETDDLLDDISTMSNKMGTEVLVIQASEMPTKQVWLPYFDINISIGR